nr:AAA family ATPase [Eubacterium sp.]
HKSSEYSKTSEYILKLLKKHKNKCLFIFTYNKENPGFAFQILPELYNYVVPIMLKEGRGKRSTAIMYLKDLIKKSDYSKYASQGKEYMEHFPGEMLSQTEVLKAYDQFGIWCIKKNILQTYDNSIAGDVTLDRDEDGDSPYDKLQNLIGLEKVKKKIDGILAANVLEKKRKSFKGHDYEAGSMHMIFAGNPGTAKTTVAKLFARIAKDKGILKSGSFVECGGMDLNYCNPEMIRNLFKEAKGGVLFIDEAYALRSESSVTSIVQEMENHKDDIICIFAGYIDAMNSFLEMNEGLKSRIPYWVDFPDYSADELTEIFRKMTEERSFTLTDEAVNEAKSILDKARIIDGFGNGRYARNLLDQAIQNQASRLVLDENALSDISEDTLFQLEKADITQLEESGTKTKERVTGTAYKELREMIGLESVKALVDKIIAHYKMNKLCIERGIRKDKASMHMVFTGNPGTAKTSVARLLAEIFKDEKILPSGKFVEVGRADLVGQFVGHTAPLVKKKFKEAKGGILFIDEAYSLCDDNLNSFGDEAINTIVQEMENHREDTIVIFAGYPGPMKDFLDRNPGMTSRIAFKLHFDDYTVDELCDITKLIVSNKEMHIKDEAMTRLRQQYEIVKQRTDYGNGRFVRKVIEEAEMNLANRLLSLEENEITTELVTTIEECDIPDLPDDPNDNKPRVGFVVK